MLKIRLICAGKLKKGWAREASEEYLKKISRYAEIELVEVEGKEIGELSRRMTEKLDPRRVKICCDVAGTSHSSESFTRFLDRSSQNGRSAFDMVVGGAYGIEETSKSYFEHSFSFSGMTFNHRLFRVMLLEQIYRSMTLLNRHPYHH